jgi:outer membrane murein-binding lipoprotein Lpp
VRNAVILLACLLGVVVLAGCGGGGGGNGEALSKADYEAAMQALQADLEASTDELPAGVRRSTGHPGDDRRAQPGFRPDGRGVAEP